MAPSDPVKPPTIKSLGFWVSRGPPRPSQSHAHTDIEGNLLVSGSVTYLLGGRHYVIEPRRLILFWAGIPHRLTAVQQPSDIIWLVLPLAWYMQWQLPETMTHKLLAGEILTATVSPSDVEMDPVLLPRWVGDMAHPKTIPHAKNDISRICMLEVEARIRRLARSISLGEPQPPSADDATGDHAARLASFMAQHYCDELTVARIAEATDLHPNYAMQLFKKRCGMSMWDYLTRLRISHAQRLLLTTDWKVHHIAIESGFATPSRFYEAFVRISQCTPKEYRRNAAGVEGG